MVDWISLNSVLSARNGVWTLVILFSLGLWRGWTGLPAVMAQWIARRQAIAAEKAADWDRLRDEVNRLDGRLKTLETEEERCRRELNEALRRLAEVEGFMTGQGKARQDAARIVAVERLTDRNGDKEGGGK